MYNLATNKNKLFDAWLPSSDTGSGVWSISGEERTS